MARCGCGASCSCLIEAGDGIRVEGIGSIENPYTIATDAADLLNRLTFTDSSSVDFTVTGLGTPTSPVQVSAVAELAMTELTDVSGTPTVNQVPVWVGDHWEFQDQSGGGAGSGLPNGGTAGQILVKSSGIDGDADWESAVTDSVILRNNAVQTMTTGVEVPMVFNATVSTDPLGMWDGTSTVTVQRSGLYHIIGTFAFAAHNNPSGSRITIIRINGSTQKQWYQTAVANQPVFATHSLTVVLSAGDSIQMRQYQSQGSNLDTYGAVLPVTPSLYVTRLGDAIGGTPLPDPVMGERVYSSNRRHNAASSIPNAAWTLVALDTPTYEDGIPWSGTQFVVPVAGHYAVDAGAAFAPNATNVRGLGIFVNAVQVTNSGDNNGGASAVIGLTTSVTVKCAVGTTIDLRVYQNSGANLALQPGATNAWLSVTKVPAPVVPGRAASGVWGVPPLDTSMYGADPAIGREIYVDAAGQLRVKPDLLTGSSVQFGVTSTAAAYPTGTSVMSISSTDGTTWPTSGAALVITQKAANNSVAQWCYPSISTVGRAWFRNGTVSGWSPWVQVGGEGVSSKTAAGRGSAVFTASSLSATVAVAFPASMFATAPRVALTGIGSSQIVYLTTASPTAAGMSVAGRQVDNSPISGTFSFDWIAVETL